MLVLVLVALLAPGDVITLTADAWMGESCVATAESRLVVCNPDLPGPYYWANPRRPDPALAGVTIRWWQRVGAGFEVQEGVVLTDGRSVFVNGEVRDYLRMQGRL